MKIKIITIALMSLLLIACGKSEEEKKKEAVDEAMSKARAEMDKAGIEMMAAETVKYQRFAVSEGLSYMSGMKSFVAEIYSQTLKCPSSKDDDALKEITKPILLESKYLKDIYFGSNCTINTTFKDSVYAPDLKGQTLTLKMKEGDGAFLWNCEFTGQNKKDIPKSCQ